MMIAARESFAAAARRRWQNPYVTDGLVAMWDGEWNAGGGRHDPEATTWKDLAGSADALTVGAGASFADNFLWLPGDPNKVGVVVMDAGVLPGWQLGGTVEMCVAFKWNFTDSPYNLQYPLSLGGAIVPCSRSYMLSAVAWDGSSKYSVTTSTMPSANSLADVYSVSASGNPVGTGTRHVYANNVRYSLNMTYPTNPAWAIQFGRARFVRPPRADCRLYTVRLYSRALPAEEVAANCAVDKARFNLPYGGFTNGRNDRDI